MIPKQAIELAKRRGWKPAEYRHRLHYRTGGKNGRGTTQTTSASITEHEIALDPTFWQALGKALGWIKEYWWPRAMKFYDLILTGGDTDAYWNELLGV
jgi:hypothetical protein